MPFTTETACNNLLRSNYPPESPINDMADRIEEELKNPETAKKYNFKEIELCSTRSSQLLGMKPITYVNEVLSLCQNPSLIENHSEAFSEEVVRRAKEMLAATDNSGMGAYTGSQGLPVVQKDVVNFINERDKLPEGYITEKDIYMTDGAAAGIKLCLQMFVDARNPRTTAYLVPSPQYNIYREFLNAMGSVAIPYELDEESGWNINIDELEKSYAIASSIGHVIRGIVVINPGNPTGELLSGEKIKKIINFALSKDIMIYADEVLQNTVVIGVHKFFSFQRAAYEVEQEAKMRGEEASPQLISFFSISKGDIAYGGLRAGYFVLHNFNPEVRAVFVKMVSISLCPNTTGQILVSLAVRGPTKGTEDEKLYNKERQDNRNALGRSMESAYTRLNYAKGIVCQPIRGGIFAYPRITVPPRAAEEAKEVGLTPSEFYCKCLLEETGIVVVPGSAFMNITGRQYIRMSLLGETEHFIEVLDRFVSFNDDWVAKYTK